MEETLVKKNAHIAAHLPNVMALAMTLERTDLIAIIPRRAATEFAKAGTLKVCKLPIVLPAFDVSIYWHERSHTSLSSVWMREQMVDLFMNKLPAKLAGR